MKYLSATLFLFFTLNLFAQSKSKSDSLSPLQVVQKYVSPNGFPEKLKYFCCELYQEWYADSTLGQHLPKTVQRTSQVIFQDTGHATVAVWLHDSITSLDIYFYLVKKQNWTIYAVRSLVMKKSAEDELKRLDSIPKKDRGKTYTQLHGHTYAFDYSNLQLWDNTDTVLVSHFIKNKKTFLAIQKQMVKKGFTTNDSLDVNALKDKKIKKLSTQVLIRNFEYDKRYPTCIFYVIGGMVDNTVGYMYQPDPKKLPLMTEKHYILIKSLGEGWYLFKTT